MIAINQDPECVMASLVRNLGSSETWIRPMADGSFGVVLLNKAAVPQNVSVFIAKSAGQWGDFFPVVFSDNQQLEVRNAGARKDEGRFNGTFTALVGPTDAAIFRMALVD